MNSVRRTNDVGVCLCVYEFVSGAYLINYNVRRFIFQRY